MSLKDQPFLWCPMITSFSKSNNSVHRDILHATETNVDSENIFNVRERDVYQDRKYLHFHKCPNTYWYLFHQWSSRFKALAKLMTCRVRTGSSLTNWTEKELYVIISIRFAPYILYKNLPSSIISKDFKVI